MEILAIIPARGGSKRIPRKNVADLCGKPLIQWTIEAALQSKMITKILVSSDDYDILSIAKKQGIAVVKRPLNLSDDKATSYDVIEHGMASMRKHYDYVMMLQPTSPLRSAFDIDASVELLKRKNADAVISVTKVEHSPLWMNTLPDDLDMSQFLDSKHEKVRSQNLPSYYRLNGAIYICQTKRLLEEKTFFFKTDLYAYIMEPKHSVDIDTVDDLRYAEYLLNRKYDN